MRSVRAVVYGSYRRAVGRYWSYLARYLGVGILNSSCTCDLPLRGVLESGLIRPLRLRYGGYWRTKVPCVVLAFRQCRVGMWYKKSAAGVFSCRTRRESKAVADSPP